MNGKDAAARLAGPVRKWIAIVTTTVVVVALCIAARFWGPGKADAQSPAQPRYQPARTTASAARASGAPAARVADAGAAPRTVAGPQAAVQGPQRVAPLTTPSAAHPSTKDLQVMAVVNHEPISRQELGRECMRRYGKEVLESMLNRQLIAEACAAQNIQITNKDVDEEIDRIAGKFGLSRDRWLMLLRDERGFTAEQYRAEVVWPMLALRRVAAGNLEVTQDELRKAFESEFGPKVRVRLIGVSSQQKAEEVRAQAVAQPDSFNELAKKKGEDPAVAAAYGVIPPIRKHLGDPNLEAAAFALQPGQISPIVKVANMYYIMKCEEQIPGQHVGEPHLTEVTKRLEDRIRENKLRTSAMQFFEEMQQKAKVVNVFNDPEKQKQMPGVAATVNGKPVTLLQLSEECIARHGREVLDGEVNRKILQQELDRRKVVVTEQDIDAEVARAADSYGFLKPDGTADVERWLEEVTSTEGATVELYVRDAVWPSVALKKLVREQVSVTEEDLRKGFESNYGERVEVLAIVLGDQRQAQKVWEMARNNPTNAFFAELAQQYSVEPSSRANGGKVPPIRRYSGAPTIEKEAFKLKQGELSGLIVAGDQYIILRCLGRTEPVAVDFAAVKGELHKDISEKKLRQLMGAEYDRLREQAQIDNYLAGTSQAPSRKTSATSATGVAPAGGAAAVRSPSQVAPATAIQR